jgi:hypothetical protein
MKLNKNTSILIFIFLIILMAIFFIVSVEDYRNSVTNNIVNNSCTDIKQTFYCNHGMCTHEYKSENIVCYVIVRSSDNVILNNYCFEK